MTEIWFATEGTESATGRTREAIGEQKGATKGRNHPKVRWKGPTRASRALPTT